MALPAAAQMPVVLVKSWGKVVLTWNASILLFAQIQHRHPVRYVTVLDFGL